EVLWFGAEDKLVFAATETGRHYVNFTLDQLERRLDATRFLRVHRGAIVNLDWAAALQPGCAGTGRLQLRDQARTEVPVSRARARTLKERLGARVPAAIGRPRGVPATLEVAPVSSSGTGV